MTNSRRVGRGQPRVAQEIHRRGALPASSSRVLCLVGPNHCQRVDAGLPARRLSERRSQCALSRRAQSLGFREHAVYPADPTGARAANYAEYERRRRALRVLKTFCLDRRPARDFRTASSTGGSDSIRRLSHDGGTTRPRGLVASVSASIATSRAPPILPRFTDPGGSTVSKSNGCARTAASRPSG